MLAVSSVPDVVVLVKTSLTLLCKLTPPKIKLSSTNLFKNGWSLMVYPQGTRVPKDDFKEFKSGAFHIALDNNVPILPVVIAGTSDIWPRGRNFLSSGKAMIKTLEPIDMTNYTKDTIDQLTKDTHKKMKKVYEELQLAIK